MIFINCSKSLIVSLNEQIFAIENSYTFVEQTHFEGNIFTCVYDLNISQFTSRLDYVHYNVLSTISAFSYNFSVRFNFFSFLVTNDFFPF